MKARKTIEVSELVDMANKLLSLSQSDIITTDFKDGVCAMLEKALHKTNSYNGFMFIDNNNSNNGTFGYVTRKYFKK